MLLCYHFSFARSSGHVIPAGAGISQIKNLYEIPAFVGFIL
jgi:hypothetical protein